MKEIKETQFGNGRANQSGMQDPGLVVKGADDPRWGALHKRRRSAPAPIRNFGLNEILELTSPVDLHNDKLHELGALVSGDEPISEAS